MLDCELMMRDSCCKLSLRLLLSDQVDCQWYVWYRACNLNLGFAGQLDCNIKMLMFSTPTSWAADRIPTCLEWDSWNHRWSFNTSGVCVFGVALASSLDLGSLGNGA